MDLTPPGLPMAWIARIPCGNLDRALDWVGCAEGGVPAGGGPDLGTVRSVLTTTKMAGADRVVRDQGADAEGLVRLLRGGRAVGGVVDLVARCSCPDLVP
jgi:hypothetical protein